MTTPHDSNLPSPELPITVRGAVVHGDRRGRLIGFPTANVSLLGGVLPGFGVYAGLLDGMPAAISIGVRPTFGNDLQPALEAHVIGFKGDLYDREVTVTLVARLRDELKFDTADDLTAQIQRDVDAVMEILQARPGRDNSFRS